MDKVLTVVLVFICVLLLINLKCGIKEPIFSPVGIECPDGYQMKVRLKNKESFINTQPISLERGKPNPDSHDLIINFDITNPNQSDMRIKDIYIEVLEYKSINYSENYHIKSPGVTRKYFCDIQPEKKQYRCVNLNKDTDYIKLACNELENFGININTVYPGIYKIRVLVEYSVADRNMIVIVKNSENEIGFFKE
jgi:hypothetical protein